MQSFSSEQRANLNAYGRNLSQEIARSGASKSEITLKSRQQHFVNWTTQTVGLDDPCHKQGPPQAQNYLLACWSVSLVKGETLRGQLIRKTTIDSYINAVLRLFTQRGIVNPRNSADTDLVKLILTAVGAYEQVAKRRHMISDEMMLYMLELAKEAHPDSLVAAVVD